MQENFEKLSLIQLRELAKEQGVKKISSLRKSELIAVLKGEPSTVQQDLPEKESQNTSNNVPAADQGKEIKTEQHTRSVNRPAGRNDNRTNRGDGRYSGRPDNRTDNRYTTRNDGRSFSTSDNRNNNRYNNRTDNTDNRYNNRTDNTDNRYNNRTDNTDNRYNNRTDNIDSRYNNRGDNRTFSISDNRIGSRTGSRNPIEYKNDRPAVSPEDEYRIRNGSAMVEDPDMIEQGTEPIPISEELESLDSGCIAHGIFENVPEGNYGFIRSDNYLTGTDDVYVSPTQIRKFDLRTGDIIEGAIRVTQSNEKFPALLYIKSINGEKPENFPRRPHFANLTPVFPDSRLQLETPGCSIAMRIMNMFAPIGKGQRGMIVSPPKAGKTTLLKQVANAVKINHPEVHIIILLIDERPEEVTDIKEFVKGSNVEVIHSTFDELPEHHKRVSEMVLARAKRLVEQGRDVMILLDSITRLTRAYNLTVTASGRTLSGGLDPAALNSPKKFFGAARNMREGGSLTILATALVDTGSRMDDVVFEEFKGTGNMELVLDRKLSEKRIFPAIDLLKSGTRRDDLLLTQEEQEAMTVIRNQMNCMKPEEITERVLKTFYKTRSNSETIGVLKGFGSVPNL